MNDPFLEHRKKQEKRHASNADPTNLFSSLISIELNVLDGCNRTCVFCPHTDPVKYPNRYDWKLERSTSLKIADELSARSYQGRISFSGYGEPLLNKQVFDHIQIYHQRLPGNVIEMNTNGDPLSAKMIRKLYSAGLTQLYVNLYDGTAQREKFIEMFREAEIHEYVLRPHWNPKNDHGLTLNNRSGFLEPLAEPP